MADKKKVLSAKDTELLYRDCLGCKMLEGRITVTGQHCLVGTPVLKDKKCANRK